jgi:hypothetical protein
VTGGVGGNGRNLPVLLAKFRRRVRIPPSPPELPYVALRRIEQQESTLKLLAIAFGGDPACTDCNRVLRLPGFLNCKYDPAYPVTVEYPCDSTSNPGDFRLDITLRL